MRNPIAAQKTQTYSHNMESKFISAALLSNSGRSIPAKASRDNVLASAACIGHLGEFNF